MKTIFSSLLRLGLSLSLSLSLVLTTHAQSPDCKKFKTGTFFYPQVPDYGYTIRENDVQKSFIAENKMWMYWNVKWTGDCSFELTFDRAEGSDGTFKKGDRIVATITATDGDCYTFTGIFYNAENPKGKEFPPGKMCIRKE